VLPHEEEGSPVKQSKIILALLVGSVVAGLGPPASAVHGGDREVTVGSNDSIFSQNKQNEPAVAVDPINPNVLVAGANDNIDMEACNAGDDTTCPFTPNVGATGIQFSFDRGHSWTQPTYSGLTARDCLGAPGPNDPDCVAHQGPIGTLPRYDEANLVADGDPAMAFGPQPGADGEFSWENGSRLYFANLTSAVSADLGEPPFKGFEAIAVSRTDDVAAAAAGDESAWRRPVIASKQSASTFADKEQIWADNASSSPFFGNVYVCYAAFKGFGAAPLVVSTSTDGGNTWATKQVSPAHNVSPKHFGQSGCTIRTDSRGTAYVFYEEFQEPSKFSPPAATHMMVRSFDGGTSWSKPQTILAAVDPCFHVDPVIGRCVMDGIAGARSDLAAAPSVSIANGAPFGTRNGQPNGPPATDEIVNVWVDGRDGLNKEDVMLSYSTNRGQTWSNPVRISNPPDRGYYAAPALSPDGRDLYVVYNAFTTPFRQTTFTQRSLVGVVLHFDISLGGAPINRTEMHRGATGEPRGSSQNNLEAEFLGDYVYATATNGYGAAVWNDARSAANCPAMNAWRMSLRTETEEDDVPTPAPQQDCPPTFGNTDIFGWSGSDPTAP
jgi:hypothetical protein